jgi:uncharacterized protein (TIGR02145 family)
MRTQFSKFALTVALGLAITFTFNACSGDGGGGGGCIGDECGSIDPNNPNAGGGTPGDNGGSSSSDGSSDSPLPGGRTSSSSYPFPSYYSSSSADLCAGFVNGTEREHFGKNKAQFCDSRDGKKYVYVTIGSGATAQTWMAENLNYTEYRDRYSNVCLGAFAGADGDCDAYGRFYTWEKASNCYNECSNSAIQGICPSGWHIPSNAEWDALFHFVDGTSGDEDDPNGYQSVTAGKYLKAQDGWDNCEPYNRCYDVFNEDTYGFAALPGGYYNAGAGSSIDYGKIGYWWSSSWWYSSYHGTNRAYTREMHYDYNYTVTNAQSDRGILYNVRCIKDSP